MNSKKKFCKNCGAEITYPKAKVCTNCGAKISKPIIKKWWFWVIIAVVVISIGSAAGSSDSTTDTGNPPTNSSQQQESQTGSSSNSKTYTVVDLQTMLDELESNAMKAQSTYLNQYVEVTGKIANIDSSGAYISIEPKNADEWNFETVLCYIKSDAQRDVIIEKNKGDVVTIKGKIISVGEVLGYSLNIDEIK